MIINGVEIEDTFAEAFPMRATRVIITAINYKWARHAAETMTGFATSVIGCGVEAGIEKVIGNHETPDGRPGVSVLLFSTDKKTLEKQLQNSHWPVRSNLPYYSCLFRIRRRRPNCTWNKHSLFRRRLSNL